MGGGGIFGGVGKLFFGDGGASEYKDASAQSAQASLEATRESLAQQKAMYEDNKALNMPMYQMGLSALTQAYGQKNADGTYSFDPNKLNQYTVDKPFEYKDFTSANQTFDPNTVDLTKDPSYQFRLNEGISALDKSASAKGMLLSGAQQKALNNYASDYASQEYSNAYQRGLNTQQSNYAQDLSAYQQNQGNALTGYNSNVNLGNQRYNQVASLLGLNQTSANQLQQNNTNFANTATATNMQNANNLASAYAYRANGVGSANRWLSNTSYNAFNDQLQNAMSMTSSMMSDSRLKTNIHLVGEYKGLNVYEYDYVWGEHGIGVMAQEALAKYPHVVAVHPSGYYMVNYSKLGAL